MHGPSAAPEQDPLAGAELRLAVRPGARGNEILLRLAAAGDARGRAGVLARLAALLAAGVAPFASRVELQAAPEDKGAEMRFTADKRELTKSALGGIRREALLKLAAAGSERQG